MGEIVRIHCLSWLLLDDIKDFRFQLGQGKDLGLFSYKQKKGLKNLFASFLGDLKHIKSCAYTCLVQVVIRILGPLFFLV